GKTANKSTLPAMEEVMPQLYRELDAVRRKLEAHYRDMQDIEFTVQQGRLWMLQTRSGKRTAAAALKVAVDMVGEGLIDRRGTIVKDGDLVTIDGATGEVMLGEVPTVQPDLSGDFATLMQWADEVRKLRVRANAETPADARTARRFGAEGIGLCRTEHMFFDNGRIVAMREMIMAEDTAGRRAALAKILPMQRDDFIELFRIMRGLPVTIRLLDPPLHEFLPHSDAEVAEVAKASGTSAEALRQRALELKESNPMLGHRGCRLGISYPEIYEMQARGIFEAAVQVGKGKNAVPVNVEVMIPLTAYAGEFKNQCSIVHRVAAEVVEKSKVRIEYLV